MNRSCLLFLDFHLVRKLKRGNATSRGSLKIIWNHMGPIAESVNHPDLAKRMVCCNILAEDLVVGAEYPKGSIFNLKHPCDIFLRSLMGYPILDAFVMETHDKLLSLSSDCKPARIDPLTAYITGRR